VEKEKTEIQTLWEDKDLRAKTQALNEYLREQDSLDDARDTADSDTEVVRQGHT